MRAANLHAVPGPDSRAELGRDQPARQSPDMKHELGIVPRAVHATARAVFARREAGELDPEILAGPERERRVELDHDFEHLRGQRGYLREDAGTLGRHRHFIEHDFGVAFDCGEARQHGVAVAGALVVDCAAHHGDAAGVALARTAIMRNHDPAAQTGIDQRLADLCFDRSAVDEKVASVTHGCHRGSGERIGPGRSVNRARRCGPGADGGCDVSGYDRTRRPTCRDRGRPRSPGRTCSRSRGRGS